MINYRHLFFVVFLFFYGCVETLISVTIIPDGRYHVKIESQGDERDIKDKDFNLPSSTIGVLKSFKNRISTQTKLSLYGPLKVSFQAEIF